MAQQVIGVGGAGDDHTGDQNRVAFQKSNANFTELYGLGPFQPLDADLTAIAALGGTNNLYYRSGANTWTSITFTAPLSFSGGAVSIDLSAYLTSAAAAAAYQPLDGDLTALAALSGTNTIYYRSASNTWSPVTFSGLTFSGGVLTASVSGGNVSNSGTPTVGQYGKWVTATTIQGVSPATVLSDIGAQASDAELTAIAGLVSAADQVPYFTGPGTAALATVTAAARTVLDDTTVAAMLTTLGGQPLDGDLTAIAALAGTNNIYYRSGANTWTGVTFTAPVAFSGGAISVDLSAYQTAAVAAAAYVAKAGDTMTGNLAISKASPQLNLQKSASGQAANLSGYNGTAGAGLRWVMQLGDSTAEAGSNSGSDFALNRYDDTGAQLGGSIISIVRSTGTLTLTGTPIAPTPATTTSSNQIATCAYVKANFVPVVETVTSLTYSTSIAVNAALGNIFQITATNATAFTIGLPSNPVSGQTIIFIIRNTSGGALGTITWTAGYRMAAFVSPATGFCRSIAFVYTGANWIMLWQSAADVTNG